MRTTKPCTRCGHPHIEVDSTICDHCWVELGQMPLWEDGYEPAIDTVFDREEEARGYQ
jgi:hypothetical protein